MGEKAASTYIYLLAASALASLGAWLYLFGFSSGWTEPAAAAVLTLVCAVSLRFPIRFGRADVDAADVAMLTALVMLGPLWALLVATPAALSYRSNRMRLLFVAACDSVKLLSAGFVFRAFSVPLLGGSGTDASFVYGAAAAGVTFYALDAVINCTLLRLKYETPMKDTFVESLLPLIPSDLAAVSTAVGASYAAATFGPAVALVLLCGISGALISHRMIHEREERIQNLEAEVENLSSAPLAFASAMVLSLGRKDGRTARHAAASAVYAADLAGELGLDSSKMAKLKTAALLQDVGLAGVPDEVLTTPPKNLNSIGALQFEEHALHGERILSAAHGFEEAARWVRWHHEREDGTGYPDRLRGNWIPLEAKILAVCGTYSSLVIDGPRNPGLEPREARRQLVAMSGVSLDMEVVRTFLRLLDTKDANYAAASDDRFAFPASEDQIRIAGQSS